MAHASARPNPSTAEPHRDAARLRAFVVEDSGVILGNLSETLEENTPVTVIGSADDEATAEAWLQANPEGCDLVIVDIFLKEGSGIGLLRRLRDRPAVPRRVVLSNHATPDVRKACLELGAEKVFDKSNEIDEMLGWLRRLPQEPARATAG